MIIVTKRFALQALLEKAAGIVPTKESVPILKNFLVEATTEPGKLSVAATDLELSMVASTLMVQVEEEGRALLPANRMLQILREASDDDLSLVVADHKALLEVGKTSWNLSIQDDAEYPELPDLEESTYETVSLPEFLNGLKSVRYAAATEVARLNLMIVDIRDGKMRASDGVRFQQIDLPKFPLNISIPIAAVGDLVKALQVSSAATLDIGENENYLIFRIGGDSFIAQKLNVEYPDMESQVLKPALANDQKLHVDRNQLIQAIKQVRITADPDTSAIRLILLPASEKSGAKMLVHSKDKYNSQTTTELDVSFTGPERSVTVNHDHLMQMLSMTNVKSCTFYLGQDLKSRLSPILLRDLDSGMLGVLSQTRPDFMS